MSILNSGKLYSRDKVKELKLLKTDIANDDVINHTSEKVDKYARLYFGAKTPTMYNNEGLIPKNDIQNNAHCPIPIFLLFDFVDVLSLDGIWFSNGNMGVDENRIEVYNDIRKLNNLEWEYIYHRESLYQLENARHINYCRNAEVLVQHELNVYDALKWICVRSKADKDSLLNLVSKSTQKKIKDKIKIFTGDGLFHNKRLYIDNVRINKEQINIEFTNANNQKFKLNGIAKSLSDGKVLNKTKLFEIKSNIKFPLDGLDSSSGIHFELKIDENIVYDNILFEINEMLI